MTELFKKLLASPEKTAETMSFIDFGPIMKEFIDNEKMKDYDFKFMVRRFENIIKGMSPNIPADMESAKAMSRQLAILAQQTNQFQASIIQICQANL